MRKVMHSSPNKRRFYSASASQLSSSSQKRDKPTTNRSVSLNSVYRYRPRQVKSNIKHVVNFVCISISEDSFGDR